jgi:hypothetical protein
MPALQFATATANLASQNAFLFLATHGPIFIASSCSATLIQCGFQYRRWNCSPIPPLAVKPPPPPTLASGPSMYIITDLSRANPT